MKVFATVCLLGLLVAAFSVVAVIAQPEAEESADDGASRQLLVVVRELLDGRDVACERIVRPLLGIDEHAEVDDEQLLRLLLGLDEGEAIDNEQLVRLLLGIDDHEEIDKEQILRLLETVEAGLQQAN
jgi:hypothetical protein